MMASSEQENRRAAGLPLEQYAPEPGIFDEMLSRPGVYRPHWEKFASVMGRLSPPELASRWENGLRIIREHGVTYNVYGDARGAERPWALDLAPLVVAANDWAWVERGLMQRVRLLNVILADIYAGSQHLLRDGLIPPDLVYANPGFLRACRGFSPAKDVYLSFYACDLARSTDGRWWVLADRTQAPSGAGYALENRAVISRVLPDELGACNVRRLGSFFRARREKMLHLSPPCSDEPRGVLLTPGPLNEVYFEHAFLARQMGLPLVEGADLTVRDRRVFLKTVEGLQPVSFIIRRVDDTFCDPLELRDDSFLGVPGLVEAARAGSVAISNALGTGLLEGPAFMAFLPALCRHLLGEELLMPSVATWWCGQAKELNYVLAHFDELVIKPAFGPPRQQPWFGGGLSQPEKAGLLKAIKASPHNFVGQERVVLSRAPVWSERGFEARSVVLRTFVANGGESMSVMPGGLTRVSPTAEDPVVSMQSGGGSKDTWVLVDELAPAVFAPSVREVRPLVRGSNTVPSRAADNLFWLGRYAERVENTVRLVRGVLSRVADGGERDRMPELGILPELCEFLDLPVPDSLDTSAGGRLLEHALSLLYREDVTGSVRELLSRMHAIASKVRDRFSGDTWRLLGRMEREARGGPGRMPLNNALSLIHRLVLDLAAFSGLEMENMTRGHGWRFLDLGRRLERGVCTAGFLRSGLLMEGDSAAAFELLLELADSTMTYRRIYFSEVRPMEAMELMLRDDSNPRAIAFQLELIGEHLRALPPGGERTVSQQVRLAERLRGSLRDLDMRESGALAQSLGDTAEGLLEISDGITHHYFDHIVARLS